MTDNFNLEMQQCFLEEAKELLESAEQCFLSLEKSSSNPEMLDQIFRLAHNLKGSAKAVGFDALGAFTHDLETFLLALKSGEASVCESVVSLLLRCNDFLRSSVAALRENPDARLDGSLLQSELKSALTEPPVAQLHIVEMPSAKNTNQKNLEPPPTLEEHGELQLTTKKSQPKASTNSDESIRISLNKIDDLLNGVGELVIHQTVLDQHKYASGNMLIRKTVEHMSKIIRNVQNLSMSLRMVPMKQTFQKMNRIVRDVSQVLEKNVDLTLTGENTEIDKIVLEQIGDPLVHLIRNAVDHGLESTARRIEVGKPAAGKISLSAYQHAGNLVIEIEDDGKGIDPNEIRKKALSIGLMTEHQNLSDADLLQLIFAPGFSTKETVTDVSGRGVGMNVVKTNITQLQGQIDIASVVGKGTRFRVSLPLTLAIIEGVVAKLDDQRVVIPLSQISEFYRVRESDVTFIRGSSILISLRNETLPAILLSELLHKNKPKASERKPWEMTALIARDSNQNAFAILVSEVVGLQQVVIKPVGDELGSRSEIKGAAILGDGTPSLIIDIIELLGSKKNSNQNKPSKILSEAA